MQINYVAEPTMARFHASPAFVRGLRGPIGTGKSVGMCMEILAKASNQRVFNGVRKSRWAAIRNTYGELKTTTIKTWQDWVPEEVAPMRWDTPIVSHMLCELPDGTTMDLEVMFISLDRPADVKKLKSLELTGVWINEASELPKAILDMATGRVGRYPSAKDGGSNWSGIIMDTNSPDDDHWWYELAETLKPDGYEFFAQPGALIKVGERYEPNPAAENVQNHSLGYEYWLRQIPGKSPDWIKVYVLGQYGSIHDGKPVYPEWNDELHVKEISPIVGVPLDIGFDFGLTPAAVICQKDARGRLLVLDELCGQDMGFRTFLDDILIPQLSDVYADWWKKKDKMIKCVGDPAGAQRSDADEKTCFEEAKLVGLRIEPAATNAPMARRDAVGWYLSRLADGKPTFFLDPCCQTLRKGFNGGYKYRRLQVIGEERYTSEPLKNQFSHPHDALQYVAVKYGGAAAMRKTGRETKAPMIPSFKPLDATMGY